MPTGYTAIIEEKPGLTLREFALRCARGMGACVMQREDDMNDPPKAPEPSDYHLKAGKAAESKLRELNGLSAKAARALFDAEVARIRADNTKHLADANAKKERYASMRAKVAAWQPPTAQHVGLQRFMLEQIDLCKSDWTPYEQAVPADPAKWLADQIASARDSVSYHAKGHAEELSRAAERKQWIDALYAGLPEGT